MHVGNHDDDKVAVDRTPTMWLGTVQGGRVYLHRPAPVANLQASRPMQQHVRETPSEPTLVIRETRGRIRVVYITARSTPDPSGRALFQQIANAVEEAAAHPDIGAVLLCAETNALAAPYTFATMQNDLNARFAFRHMLETVVACDKPVMLAAQGDVRGWASSLMMRVDVVYGSQDVRIRPPLVTLSSTRPDGSVLLTRMMGHQRASEWVLSGRWLDVAEATAVRRQQATLRMQPGYDHSYFFISTFMEDHVAVHAEALYAG